MQHKKYYVINRGRSTGIFTDINYVRTQVDNFKNADYKVFKNKYKAIRYFFSDSYNSESFFSSDNNVSDSVFDVTAYTDGSFNRQINTFTFGVLIFYNNSKFEMYEKFNNKKWLKLENASGEIMGVIKVIDFCLSNNIKSVLIYCDYKNLYFWLMQKNIKCDKIKMYKEYMYKAQQKDLTIVFKWVKSHSNNKYNDIADFLANEAYNLNHFSQVYLK